MSRDAQEGFQLYQEMFSKGINLVFLKEPHISTDVYKQTLQNAVSMTGTDVDIILKAVNEYLMKLAERQIEIAFQTAQHEVEFLLKVTEDVDGYRYLLLIDKVPEDFKNSFDAGRFNTADVANTVAKQERIKYDPKEFEYDEDDWLINPGDTTTIFQTTTLFQQS